MTTLENALKINNGKAVLLSIKKEWLSKIMAGEKVMEVRKSMPWEISHPFVVFCYETKSNGGAGKVAAAFIRLRRKPPCFSYGDIRRSET